MNKKSFLLLFAVMLAACTRSERPVQQQAPSEQPAKDQPTSESSTRQKAPLLTGGGSITYIPDRTRVLTGNDGQAGDMSWISLGMPFSSLQNDTRNGLSLGNTPLLDSEHNGTGPSLPAGIRVSVLEQSGWKNAGSEYRNYYRVRSAAGSKAVEGWVDSSSIALVTAEADGIGAGVVLRKIAISGGESEFNLLAIAQGGKQTLVDTSFFVFPDAFHLSGVVALSINDMNADGLPELAVEAETIVSLRYLGATPLRWVAWLRPLDGFWKPILLYNKSFATDEGTSYTASARALDSSGKGMLDTVRVTTEYLLVSDQREYRATAVSFYPWNGSMYKKAPMQDLPKQGSVTADQAPLLQEAGLESAAVATLRKGDLLYVFDRSDTRQTSEDPSSWWYMTLSKTGVEGWISAANVELSWIDPLKVNREVFLGQAVSP